MKYNVKSATNEMSSQFRALRDDAHTDLELPPLMTKKERLAAQRAKDGIVTERHADEIVRAADTAAAQVRDAAAAEHKKKSTPGGDKNKRIHDAKLAAFRLEYQKSRHKMGHTKAVAAAAKVIDVHGRTGFSYASKLGLKSEKKVSRN